MTFFTEIGKPILKFIQKPERPQIAKTMQSKNSNTGSIIIFDFKLFKRTIAINSGILYKNRHKNEWNRIEDAVTNPCSYSHLIFCKGAQNILWRKDSLLYKWLWKNWITACRRLKLDPCLSPCTN
jgi:uncharacterized protein with PQ loop repeat